MAETRKPEAFDPFAEPLRARVFRYSRRMCRLPQDAEEITQEAMLKAFVSLPQLRDRNRLRPWILRIARNVCLMRRRTSLPELVPLEGLPPQCEPAAGGRPPDAGLLESELRAAIGRVLFELPALYRGVVTLRDIEGLSTEETARILRVNAAVVKTRLHRGRSAMRQKLAAYIRNSARQSSR